MFYINQDTLGWFLCYEIGYSNSFLDCGIKWMPDQLTLFAYSESEGKYYMQGAEFIKMFHVECLGDGFPKQAGLYSLDDIDEDSLKEYVYFVKEFDHIYKGDSD